MVRIAGSREAVKAVLKLKRLNSREGDDARDDEVGAGLDSYDLHSIQLQAGRNLEEAGRSALALPFLLFLEHQMQEQIHRGHRVPPSFEPPFDDAASLLPGPPGFIFQTSKLLEAAGVATIQY